MTRLKPFLILLLTFITVNSIYCQKIFRDGYIVRRSGEIMTGLVKYSNNQKNPSVCTFKRFEIAREVEYTPRDLQAFGYRNGNRYESRESDGKTAFYEVIVSGKIMLFRKGSKYYLDKNFTGLTELSDGAISFSAGGQKTDFKNLKEFLKYVTEGKTDIPVKINLKENLAPIILAYNKDSGQNYKKYNRSISEKELRRMELRYGANKNLFGILSGINIYKLNLTNETKRYLPDPENEVSSINGLTFERSLSRKNDKLSLRIDILYLKQTFYSFEEGSDYRGLIRNDVFFDFTGFKAPLLLQYSLTGKKFVPFFNAGIAYQYLTGHSYLQIEDVEDNLHEISTNEYRDLQFKPGEISAIGGLGVKLKVYKDFVLNIQGRAELGSGLFLNTQNDKIAFRQNSIQSTILLGITF